MAKPGRKPKVVPGEVLDVFGAREDRAEPLIASEVGDTLGCSRKTAYNKLRALEEDGDLTSKKVGGRSRVYWVPITDDHGSRSDSDHEERERTGASDPETTVGDTRNNPVTALDERLLDDIAADTLPGSGAKLADRREALRAVVDYLREHGTAEPADFKRDVYPEYNGRYTDGENPANSWWKNCIYKGLRELSERTETVEKADTTGEWSYRGGGGAV